MTYKTSTWDLERGSKKSARDASRIDQSETEYILQTGRRTKPFFRWTKIKRRLIKFLDELLTLTLIGLFFWGMAIIMGGATLFESTILGFLFGLALMFGSIGLCHLYADRCPRKENSDDSSNVPEPIPTYSCTTRDPKPIQEQELRLWKQRMADARARARRRVPKGTKRMRQLNAHIFDVTE
ncbi:MAG: hypothetical protein F4W92_05630 [Gammaproteobacteria bacterium]|nr:hypothetical protein [Gammaproteobacteria bacterium]